MFILVRSNDLTGEGVVFNSDYVVRMDSTPTNIRLTMLDKSTVVLTRDEYKRLGKNIFKVTKIDEV